MNIKNMSRIIIDCVKNAIKLEICFAEIFWHICNRYLWPSQVP